jgi:anthranilate/para-aminobenzoate synthase component I
VGAGIFADFHPKTELEETTNKAMALIKALKLVEHGLDGEID